MGHSPAKNKIKKNKKQDTNPRKVKNDKIDKSEKQDEPLGKNKIVKSDKKNSRLNQLDASEGKTEIDISDNQEKVNIEKSDKPDVPLEKGLKKNTGKKLNKTGVKRRTRLAPNTRSINTAG